LAHVRILLSMPIVFALGVSGIADVDRRLPDAELSSALVSGSQSWVLSPSCLIFAGNLMGALRHEPRARELGALTAGSGRASACRCSWGVFLSDICGSNAESPHSARR